MNKIEQLITTPSDSSGSSDSSESSGTAATVTGPSSFDPRTDLAAAVELAGRTLAAVRPEQYDSPTPCEEFDVRRLSSHLVAVVRRISVIGRGEDPFSVPSFADEIADGAWAAAWGPGAREVAEVWADPGILGRQLRLPIGVLPGAAAAAIYTHELTVHTWDLARATGQDPDWDPALIERVIGVVRRALPAEPRGGRIPFGEAVAVDAGAPAIDRLVAWAGRRP
ncbi:MULTISPECIES: TIGR03086 family metal-binding protein [Streptomyces]|uniref:TIGR03086 family protein n=1 Tax=Streptomyces amritsarensis TaxID=681158 RepID=A0ABX3G3U9_9ACTN|nr:MULTISPECIES: TIGR03086 family metal-binding protein [Streptomyces]AQT70833.1 TIGR03086 family protein [Streptomyces sp. fd1-xmd]OLZ64161.1 TIGR03086 family protein [Streptomyces amritsarensis]